MSVTYMTDGMKAVRENIGRGRATVRNPSKEARVLGIDSFRYLPRSLERLYRDAVVAVVAQTPFSPLGKPLNQSRIALLTTAGIWDRTRDVGFDYAREKREPFWGDPSGRIIPAAIEGDNVGTGHLHINNLHIQSDFNVVLPLDRLRELVGQGVVGAIAKNHYSVMGYQGFPPHLAAWEHETIPHFIGQLQADDVDAVVLAPV